MESQFQRHPWDLNTQLLLQVKILIWKHFSHSLFWLNNHSSASCGITFALVHCFSLYFMFTLFPDGGEPLSWGGGELGRLGHGHESSILGFLKSSRFKFMLVYSPSHSSIAHNYFNITI